MGTTSIVSLKVVAGLLQLEVFIALRLFEPRGRLWGGLACWPKKPNSRGYDTQHGHAEA
jgi:hypothetical protein